MDALILQAVLPEVRTALGGHAVSKVEIVGKFGLLLRFRNERRNLYLSAHPELSRVGLAAELPPGPHPARGPDNLTKPLTGAVLDEVNQAPGDRVVTFRFRRGGDGIALVAELIPRFANAILLGPDERILWSRRTFTGDRPRRIAAGLAYEPPPPDPGRRLPDLDADAIRERLATGDGPLHRRLPAGWGGGPQGPARVFEEADLDVADRLADLAAASRAPTPIVLHRIETGERRLFPADPGPVPGWEAEHFDSPTATSESWYRWREESENSEQLLGDLRRVLVKRRARAAKALRQVEARREEAGKEATIRRQAELLTANLDGVTRGMKEVTLDDFDGSSTVSIALDPKLDARANANALFKKARRLARGRAELETQATIQAAEIEETDRVLALLEPDLPIAQLIELVREHSPSILTGRPGAGATAAARRPRREEDRGTLPAGFTPRRYELPGGWEVWVGRDSRQNDELTHRHASQRDLWFHARGSQGSHAVLRMKSGKGEPPKEVLLAAASIAAFHSKARNSGLVPVAYTEKRYVRKPRGAPAGTAAMMREKVLMVEPKLPEGADR